MQCKLGGGGRVVGYKGFPPINFSFCWCWFERYRIFDVCVQSWRHDDGFDFSFFPHLRFLSALPGLNFLAGHVALVVTKQQEEGGNEAEEDSFHASTVVDLAHPCVVQIALYWALGETIYRAINKGLCKSI